MQKTVIVIVGPTAIGKTELAIELAQRFQTEILSADSRQFYEELNIGVARPSAHQLQAVKHHFVSCRSVQEEYNAGEYEKDALECLEKIFRKKNVAILVGGSGLYVRAVCAGFDAVPPGDDEVKGQLERELKEKGLQHLQEELKKVDPEYFKTADIQNPRRVLRALEVYRTTGKPFSAHHTTTPAIRNFRIVKIGLNADRSILYKRINQRVDVMLQSGLEEEAKEMFSLRTCKALQTVGYQELFNYFEGKTDKETAINLIKQHTRNFAKRQLTWFKKEKDIQWFDAGDNERILAYLNEKISDNESTH